MLIRDGDLVQAAVCHLQLWLSPCGACKSDPWPLAFYLRWCFVDGLKTAACPNRICDRLWFLNASKSPCSCIVVIFASFQSCSDGELKGVTWEMLIGALLLEKSHCGIIL